MSGVSWESIDYSSKRQASQWRAKMAKLMDLAPTDIPEWELQHLMREVESIRRMIMDHSPRP